MRRLLSYLFMALSLLCFWRCPCLRRAEKRPARYQLGGHHRRIFHGDRVRGLRTGTGPRPLPSAAEALGRNPAARPGIQFALILGLALIESLALYTLVISSSR